MDWLPEDPNPAKPRIVKIKIDNSHARPQVAIWRKERSRIRYYHPTDSSISRLAEAITLYCQMQLYWGGTYFLIHGYRRGA